MEVQITRRESRDIYLRPAYKSVISIFARRSLEPMQGGVEVAMYL